MLCYRDMTFCPFWSDCEKGMDCSRAMDDRAVAAANANGLLVSQFSEKPECYKERNRK
jgi:hypothetical protein